MPEIPTAGNGGPGGKLIPAKCSMCGKKNLAAAPEVRWLGTDGSGRGITVQPFVCEDCGFIAPMLAKSQPQAGQ